MQRGGSVADGQLETVEGITREVVGGVAVRLAPGTKDFGTSRQEGGVYVAVTIRNQGNNEFPSAWGSLLLVLSDLLQVLLSA